MLAICPVKFNYSQSANMSGPNFKGKFQDRFEEILYYCTNKKDSGNIVDQMETLYDELFETNPQKAVDTLEKIKDHYLNNKTYFISARDSILKNADRILQTMKTTKPHLRFKF